MVGKVFVEFRGDSSDFSEVVPGGVGEIMVLQVVAKVKVQYVPPSDVVICLLSLDELVVLSYYVDCCRVRTD